MVEKDSQFRIRLPIHLKERIEESAVANGRSLNAEIVFRLGNEPASDTQATDFLRDEASELEAQIPNIKWELDQAHLRMGEMIAAVLNSGKPAPNEQIELLQTQTRFYRAKLDEAESRLRRIKRALGR